MIATHRAFDLTWAIPFEFPVFSTIDPARAGDADVVIVERDVPRPTRHADWAGPLRAVEGGTITYGLPDTARMRVSDGSLVEVQRHPGCTESALRLLLMGPGAAFVLHQRGVLPLHGSGIVTDHGAVLFVGHSGAGKSTLTGAFIDRGFPVVGDDLAAVSVPADGHPTVAPGTTTLKMWADSVESLGWNTDGLERVRPELAKFVVPVRGRVDAPVRLAAIYHLGTHNGRTVVFEPRERAAKFNTVLDHTWQKMTVKRMGLHGIHFRRAVAIADAVPVVGVRRPDGVAVHDSGIVDLILADLATRV